MPKRNEQAITITHGYSKDHRSDLKQAVLELMVSQDGGVSMVSKSWDGNAPDTKIFLQRAEASGNKAQQHEWEASEKQLFHFQAKRFETLEAAHAAPAALAKSWRYHQIATFRAIEHKHYANNGRPTPTSPIKSIDWQI